MSVSLTSDDGPADVVLVDMTGQLGNQLYVLANVLAASIELGFRVFAPAFRYGGLLASRGIFAEGPAPRVWRGFPLVGGFLRRSRLHRHVFRWGKTAYLNISPSHDMRGRAYDLESAHFQTLLARCDRLYVAGLYYRARRAVARRKAEVLEMLRPADEVLGAANARVAEIRKARQFVVGLHVRRRDYRTDDGGRYNFSDAAYVASVQGLLGRMDRPGAAVMICSDEPVDLQAYGSLNVYPGPGDAFEDLCALSLADLIVGPPSTFSGWASFAGNVPKVEMTSGSAPLDVAAAFVTEF